MILGDAEVQEALGQVRAAFPHFTNWEFSNQDDDDHCGFATWGEYVFDPDEDFPTTFFITLDTSKDTWRGHLSVGQHVYFWTSADFGDAVLVGTETCASLTEAITALKAEIARLFQAFSAT